MDVLSDAVTTMRTGRPHSGLRRRRGPWHDEFPASTGAGFHVVLRGSCWFRPRGGEAVLLGAGDVVFLPREPGHRLDSVDDAETVLLCGAYQLGGSRPHPLWSDLPEYVHISARVGDVGPLRATVDLLGAELTEAGPGSDAMVPALLDTLLIGMLRFWIDAEPDRHAGRWASALRDAAITAALTGIHRDPARAWTVAELAGVAGLSRSSFSQRFTAMIGQPPMAYLAWWRMTVAAKLLRDRDVSVAAAARSVGYGSEFAFAKAFKREYGITPGAYRRPGRPDG